MNAVASSSSSVTSADRALLYGNVIDLCDDTKPTAFSRQGDTANDGELAQQLQWEEDGLELFGAMLDHRSPPVAPQADDGDGKQPAATQATPQPNHVATDALETHNDEIMAAELQRLETKQDRLHEKRKRDEERDMRRGPTGRAYTFVEQVLALVDRMDDPGAADIVQPVAVDDMVFTAERLLEAQEAFRNEGKPVTVDVGYHYTDAKNLDSIKENGLLSKLERQESNIESKFNGASYGHGIYTAPGPVAFAKGYGDTGLMIARLRGIDADYIPPKHPYRPDVRTKNRLPTKGGSASVHPYDSLTGHRGRNTEFTVLSCSQLCIPVLQYEASHVYPGPMSNVIGQYHVELQGIINEIFNSEDPSPDTRRVKQKHHHVPRVVVAAIAKPAIASANHQTSAVKPANQQATITWANQPPAMASANRPPTVTWADQRAAVASANRPPTVTWAGQRAAMASANRPPTVTWADQQVAMLNVPPPHMRRYKAKAHVTYATSNPTAQSVAAAPNSNVPYPGHMTFKFRAAQIKAAPNPAPPRLTSILKAPSVWNTGPASQGLGASLVPAATTNAPPVSSTAPGIPAQPKNVRFTAPPVKTNPAPPSVVIAHQPAVAAINRKGPPIVASASLPNPAVPTSVAATKKAPPGSAPSFAARQQAVAQAMAHLHTNTAALQNPATAASRPLTVAATAPASRSTNAVRPTAIAPQPLAATGNEVVQYTAPATLDVSSNMCLWVVCKKGDYNALDECPLCFDKLTWNTFDPVVELLACNHLFHQGCIAQALGRCRQCPICRTCVGTPQGCMPSGTMTIASSKKSCAGYEPTGSFVIDYDIPAAKQLPYHSNPGLDHSSSQRRAYLPNTTDGQNLLKRYKFAFLHGLTFDVGISLTSVRDNQVTWSTIPHKTARSGGADNFGFPDAQFFESCNRALDNLNVPEAKVL